MMNFWVRLRNYFIPREGNNHHPHVLRVQTVAFVLVVAAAVEGTLLFGTSYLIPHSRLFGVIFSNALIDGTNENRVSHSLGALHESAMLDAAAQAKASDMVTHQYFAHTSPAGLTPWYWFEKAGYAFDYAGENLAVNFTDSADVMNAWMNSPDHRANILDAHFTEIGMATAQGIFDGHPATYVVELFGAPVPASPASELPIAGVIPSVIPTAAAAGGSSGHIKVTPPLTHHSSQTAAKGNAATVAIQGTATKTVTATTMVLAPVMTTAPVAAATNPVRQNNFVQSAATDPRRVVDDIYLAIILFFAAALGINVFIKMQIQHPQAILGGMLVILVAGLFIVLNQHFFGGAAIL